MDCVDQVEIPALAGQLVIKGGDQSISGRIRFAGDVRADRLLADTVNGVVVDDLLTTSTYQVALFHSS